jgi:two-component system phosphate regulon sensor histidine kinase PhoR
MNRASIRTIIFLATVSLVGIIATQYFWVKNAYNLEEKQFNEQVHFALRNVSRKLLKMNKDESEIVNPVKQMSSNYYIAFINDTVHPFLLKTLLKKEFNARNINIDFEYVIYDCFTDSIVFDDYVAIETEDKNELQSQSQEMKWDRDGHYFGVSPPQLSSLL